MGSSIFIRFFPVREVRCNPNPSRLLLTYNYHCELRTTSRIGLPAGSTDMIDNPHPRWALVMTRNNLGGVDYRVVSSDVHKREGSVVNSHSRIDRLENSSAYRLVCRQFSVRGVELRSLWVGVSEPDTGLFCPPRRTHTFPAMGRNLSPNRGSMINLHFRDDGR